MSITELFLGLALYGAEWVMILLIGCSVLSIAIIIERIVFFRKSKGDFAVFVKDLSERLNSEDSLDKTAAWCAGQNMVEAQVAAVGLEGTHTPVKVAEDAMTATIISAKTKMDKGLTILATLGNNTPFIGLFGTIIGIIQAFNALAGNDAQGPEIVMAAIAEALVATAVGIMVAIPAVMAFNLFSRAVKIRVANSETVSRLVSTYLGRQGGGASQA